MALEPCPHCHREFEHSNSGARANHLNACPYNPDNMPEGAAQPAAQPNPQPAAQPQPSTPAPASVPATVDVQGQETAPAVQPTEAIEQGLAMGNPLFNLARGGPAEKESAKADLLEMAGSAAVSYAQQARQEASEGRDRAKGADQKRIGAVDNYPRCIECNGQLTNLPPMGVEFECPHCGEILIYEPE